MTIFIRLVFIAYHIFHGYVKIYLITSVYRKVYKQLHRFTTAVSQQLTFSFWEKLPTTTRKFSTPSLKCLSLARKLLPFLISCKYSSCAFHSSNFSSPFRPSLLRATSCPCFVMFLGMLSMNVFNPHVYTKS